LATGRTKELSGTLEGAKGPRTGRSAREDVRRQSRYLTVNSYELTSLHRIRGQSGVIVSIRRRYRTVPTTTSVTTDHNMELGKIVCIGT
jgi:hypothetical protein